MKGQRTPRPIPLAAAHARYRYNPLTGEFVERRTGRVIPQPNRRMTLQIEGRPYYAHRVAWAMCHGKDPEHVIDHINQNPRDNRLANLRDVPQSVNCRNVAVWKRLSSPEARRKARLSEVAK